MKASKKMATSQTSPAMKLAKKRVFDLEKFEKVTKTAEYAVPAPFTKVDEILGMEETKLLGLVNEGLARQAWKEARAAIPGASPKIVNQLVSAFRMLPPHSTLLEGLDAEKNPTEYKAARAKQTQSVYAFIRSTPGIIDSIREAAAKANVEDEDEDDSEE